MLRNSSFSECPSRCIPCKGSRYPPTLPRPAVAILPFKLPLCQTSTEKGQMEVNSGSSLLNENSRNPFFPLIFGRCENTINASNFCPPTGTVLALGPLPQPLQLPVVQRLRDRRRRRDSVPEGAAGAADEDVCGQC